MDRLPPVLAHRVGNFASVAASELLLQANRLQRVPVIPAKRPIAFAIVQTKRDRGKPVFAGPRALRDVALACVQIVFELAGHLLDVAGIHTAFVLFVGRLGGAGRKRRKGDEKNDCQ